MQTYNQKIKRIGSNIYFLVHKNMENIIDATHNTDTGMAQIKI